MSICMATYNGARFIGAQLASILEQMQEGDELVVVDDASKDDTLDIVRSSGDPRVRIYVNEVNLGHVRTFSRALQHARHSWRVLADQDDIWAEGRLAKMRAALACPGVWLATGNARFIDAAGAAIPPVYRDLDPADSKRHCLNILRIFTGRAYYYGCNMAFSQDLARLALPIPAYVESHDLWFAMAANLAGANMHMGDVLLYRRLHGNNVTRVNRPLWRKLRSRVIFLRSLIHLAWRRLGPSA